MHVFPITLDRTKKSMLECSSKTMLHGVDFSKANAFIFRHTALETLLCGVFLCKKDGGKNGSKFYEREAGYAFGDHDGNPYDDLHAGQFSVQHH